MRGRLRGRGKIPHPTLLRKATFSHKWEKGCGFVFMMRVIYRN